MPVAAEKDVVVNGSRVGISDTAGHRTVKLVQPICEDCQTQIKHPLWWRLCKHDKYHTTSERTVREPIVEVVDSEHLITGYKEKIVEDKTLNLHQVAMTERVSAGRAVGNAAYRGSLEVTEFGLRRFCEFRNCWVQPKKLIKTVYGNFCTESEARLVGADEEGIALEVRDGKKRRRQLRDVDLYAVD